MIRTTFRFLDHFLDLVDRLFLIVANGCLAMAVVANAVNIFWRGVFDEAIILVWPWSMTLFVWATFLGFYVLYRRRKDVVVLLLLQRLSDRHQRALAVIVHLCVFSIMALMVAIAPTRIANQAGIIELIDLPRYVLSIPFFLASFFIALDSIVQVYHVVRGEEKPVSINGIEEM